MKKTLWLIFLSLCILLFSACGSDHGTASDTSDGTGSFHSVTQDVFPDAPPTLPVVFGEEQITAWRGTYSWETKNALGIGQAVCADSMHPIDIMKELPIVTAREDCAFVFDAPPDSMTVRRYPLGMMPSYENYETIIVEGSNISLSEGAALYEVIAKWEMSDKTYSGEVHYAFRIE